MAIYTVTCRGKLGRGVITQLNDRGLYLYEEAERGFEGDGMMRHYLRIEASSADDAILVAKGALAVTGGSALDYQATEGEPEWREDDADEPPPAQ
jgi:hypothetical protein